MWVIISLAAGVVQTIRFLLQKQLKSAGFSTGGATFSRFVFAVPIAWGTVALLVLAGGYALPAPGAAFWAFAFFGGLAQILGTLATVALFSQRNFAVGIAFTKTETVQVALFTAVLLGEAVSRLGFAAILIGVAGVILLSWPRGTSLMSGAFLNRAMATGLVAGMAFAFAAIGYRGAALTLGTGDYFFRAAFTLACVTTLQTLTMLAMLRLGEPGQIGKVLAGWRKTVLVGITGTLGSLGWFTAFTLQNAAYVRALGQAELIFSLILGFLIFHERVTRRELLGMAFLAVSLPLVVLAA
jgi:drug/metabolite transporter (DMT)-like permease